MISDSRVLPQKKPITPVKTSYFRTAYWFFYPEKNETGCKLTITEKGEVYNPLFRVISTYFMGHDTTIRQYLADLETSLNRISPEHNQ